MSRLILFKLSAVLAVTGAFVLSSAGQAVEAKVPREKITRLSVAMKPVNGTKGREAFRGRVLIRTPAFTWHHQNRDASPVANFTTAAARFCRAQVRISTAAVATNRDAERQVDLATRYARRTIAEGARSRGAFRVVEVSPREDRAFLGVAAIRVATKRWLHLRLSASLNGTCTDADLREGSFRSELTRLLRTARSEVGIVART